MKKVDTQHSVADSNRALEMVMRDTMDALIEASLEAAYTSTDYSIEILDITPATPITKAIGASDTSTDTNEADILEFAPLKRATG